MIIRKDDVVAASDPALKKFAASTDPAVAAVEKASKVQVIPSNAVDQSVYTVNFNVPFLVIVADPEPFIRTLSRILEAVLGSGLSATTLINQVGKLEGNIEEIGKHFKTKADTGTLSLQIPIATKKACHYTVSVTFVGKIVIDDSSKEDVAKIKAWAQWDGAPAPPKATTDFPGECNTDLSTIQAGAGGDGTGSDTAEVFFSASVTTDGGMVNTEFTSVYVEQVQVTIVEVCPSTTVPVKQGPRPTPEAPRPPAKKAKRGRRAG